MSSTQEAPHLMPPLKPKLSPMDLRNTDLVSRLLAATPPYLYNMALLPNTYFFSEMLRSFVHAKNERTNNNTNGNFYGNQIRRSRKRNYNFTQTTVEDKKDEKDDWMLKCMKKSDEEIKKDEETNLVLPPPPPMWYPPIYPTNTTPYAIDPLHFFIDLRVSGGQMAKDKEETIVRKDDEDKKNDFNDVLKKRHCSAFSVPQNNMKNRTKFDIKSMGFDKSTNRTGTNYIMTHIQDIYKNLHSNNKEPSIDVEELKEETEEAKQKRVKDLRALIGLELVVDYVSQKKGLKREDEDGLLTEESEIESCASPQLEVVAINDDV